MGRQPKSQPTPFPPLQDERIAHFALEGLLPPTQVFALNPTLRILTRLAHDRHLLHPLVLGEQQFSRKELDLLYPLLVNYPAHTPHEVLYASLHHGYARLGDRTIERALVERLMHFFPPICSRRCTSEQRTSYKAEKKWT